MSVWQYPLTASVLSGSQGELVSVSVSVDPRELESLLEALSCVSFPVNPQIYHGVQTTVEFPAYTGHLNEVRQCLGTAGLDGSAIRVKAMLDEIHTGLLRG